MIKVGTSILSINRLYDENNIPHFKLIKGKVTSIRIGKKVTKVYSREFYPLDLEDIESTTDCIDPRTGWLVVNEPFFLKDEWKEEYFQKVVDRWNEEPPKSIFD